MEVKALMCKSNPRRAVDGWAFPSTVRDLLIEETEGDSVLHLFGGKATFGTRLDFDEETRPHVVGDAWIPPFAQGSFDCVILDPPYVGDFASMSNQKTRALLAAAAWIARKRVVWFHTVWLHSPARMTLEKAWLVCVGRHCKVRCLQFFKVPDVGRKMEPCKHFKRGPAIRYNRWLHNPRGFAFDVAVARPRT